jgi:hypothetical protein
VAFRVQPIVPSIRLAPMAAIFRKDFRMESPLFKQDQDV